MHDKINNNKDDPWFRDEKLMNFLKKNNQNRAACNKSS